MRKKSQKRKELAPLGQLLLEIEPYLERFVDEHDLQKGDILALISIWIDIHRPECKETYLDGTQPKLKYGP